MTREEVESKLENTLLKLHELMLEYDEDFEYMTMTVWRDHITANNDYWTSEDKKKIDFRKSLNNSKV